MKILQNNIEEAKCQLPLPQLMEQLGYRANFGKLKFCPFHDNHKTEAFSVFQKDKLWFFKCHGGCGAGDEITFIEKAKGTNRKEAIRLYLEMAGIGIGRLFSRGSTVIPRRSAPMRGLEVPKKRCRPPMPVMEKGTRRQLADLSLLRTVNREALQLANNKGLLRFGEWHQRQAWFITDSMGWNAQARRLDGQPWDEINAKAWTLPGCWASWPIGIQESLPYPYIALVEGSPDFLAAFHFAWCESRENEIAPVAMLGASNSIPTEALSFFKRKRVRIFPHLDVAGQKAAERWTLQLEGVGAIVDCFDFSKIFRTDGKPVKDLNDLVLLNAEGFENDPELSGVMP